MSDDVCLTSFATAASDMTPCRLLHSVHISGVYVPLVFINTRLRSGDLSLSSVCWLSAFVLEIDSLQVGVLQNQWNIMFIFKQLKNYSGTDKIRVWMHCVWLQVALLVCDVFVTGLVCRPVRAGWLWPRGASSWHWVHPLHSFRTAPDWRTAREDCWAAPHTPVSLSLSLSLSLWYYFTVDMLSLF